MYKKERRKAGKRTMKAGQIDFADEKVGRNIMRAAVPMFAAQTVNLLYNIVDRIYIGKIPGEGVLALGGVGLCFPLVTLITAFANLFGVGGAPLCAIERGRGNRKEAETIMGTSFAMLVYIGILLTAVGILLHRPLLFLLGASEATFLYASSYLVIYLLGTVFVMTALGMNPFINSQGFARTGMTTVLVGAAANLILDPIFIFGFHMGVSGAAAATVLSQFLSAAWVVRFLTGEKAELKLRLRTLWRVKADTVFEIVKLGSSSFVMSFTDSLVQVTCNSVLSRSGALGDVYISVMTVLNSIRQIAQTPVMAVTDGASPILSYNYGAKAYENVKKAIRFITLSCVGYTSIAWFFMFRFPEMFIRIFNQNEQLLLTAVPAIHVYFFAFLFMSFQYAGQATFKAMNKAGLAISFSLLRKVVIVVPLTLLLPQVGGIGVMGVFLAEPISNVIGGMACFLTMLHVVRNELQADGKEAKKRK